MDLAKRDMAVTYAGRTFAVRAYLDNAGPDGPGWHAVVIENRTPLVLPQRSDLGAADCLSGAVRFVTELVESQSNGAPIR